MQAVIVDNTDARIQYSGNWTQEIASGYSGSAVHTTAFYGSSFSFSFNGTGISVVGGVPVNLDFGGATSSYKLDDDQPVPYTAPNLTYPIYYEYFFQKDDLTKGQHTLLVTLSNPDNNSSIGGLSGSQLVFDHIRYMPLEMSQESSLPNTITTTSATAQSSTTGHPLGAHNASKHVNIGLTVGIVLACVGASLVLICAVLLWQRRRRSNRRARGMDLLQDNSTYSTLRSEATLTPYMETYPHTPVASGGIISSTTVIQPGTFSRRFANDDERLERGSLASPSAHSLPAYTEQILGTVQWSRPTSKTASWATSSTPQGTAYSLPRPGFQSEGNGVGTSTSDEGSEDDSLPPPPTYRSAPSAE